MYKLQHGDVVYYDEPGFHMTWIGVVEKDFNNVGTMIRWWHAGQRRFMTPQIVPTRGNLLLVGSVNEVWIEWDV